jgi:hypothetical protein
MWRRVIAYADFTIGRPGRSNSNTTLRDPHAGHLSRPSSTDTGKAAPRVPTNVSRSRRIAALHSRIADRLEAFAPAPRASRCQPDTGVASLGEGFDHGGARSYFSGVEDPLGVVFNARRRVDPKRNRPHRDDSRDGQKHDDDEHGGLSFVLVMFS